MTRLLALGLAVALAAPAVAADAPPYKTLIIDGQNNHSWRTTTPVLKQILEETRLFKVDVATAPEAPRPPQKPKDGAGDEAKARFAEATARYLNDRAQYQKAMAQFRPKFSDYRVVVSNYNGERWPKETESAFAEFVDHGGGFVSVHAANNSFPDWPEYNAMIGVGGWGGRSEKSGPYVRFKDGQFVRDERPGPGGGHGPQHPFVVEVRTKDHPITAGLPEKWMHATDELYDKLRGPARNLTVLATAYSKPGKGTGGTGEHEPQLMVIDYGKGRVFHTTLGHSPEAMKCVGFAVTLARGAEWAASGKVTQKVPENFPTAEKVSLRP